MEIYDNDQRYGGDCGSEPDNSGECPAWKDKKDVKRDVKKVQDVIDRSNYVSNMGARVLANYGSRIIGVIMNYDRRAENNALSDPFYGTIVGALEKEIREHGYYMMLYMAGSIEETVRLASSWNIEGLVALGCHMRVLSNTTDSVT